MTVAVVLTACARLKEPATQAVASAESALAAVRDEGARYAPTELQQVEGSIDSMKASLAKGDYKAVMSAAPAVTSQLDALRNAVAQKSAEAGAAAKQQWDSLSADVRKMVEALESRVNILHSSRKLPRNVSKESLQSATDGLAAMKSDWAQATSLFGSGNMAQAVAKAQEAKAKGADALHALAMDAG
jgi:hypothetical protein